MSQLSLVFFLVAGLVGAFSGYDRGGAGAIGYGRSLAWAIVALWALLELLHAIA